MTWSIKRPKNGHMLKGFEEEPNYYYRLRDGRDVPLPIRCGWCSRCEGFVEIERLYTDQDIHQKLGDLDAMRNDWAKIDAEAIERAKRLGKVVANVQTRLMRFEAWQSALAWRKNRKSPPRCLKCGSFFAVTVLPEWEEVPHPGGSGAIIVTYDGTLGITPVDRPPVYFDSEGLLLHESLDSGRSRLADTPPA